MKGAPALRPPSGLVRRVRLGGFAAGILVLAGYPEWLGYEISQPIGRPGHYQPGALAA